MKKQNFTLVELLAVLVIMSILLGITIPAFRSLTKGNAPDRAAREIMGRVAATRAYAAAKRVNTALIFAANETGIPTTLQYSAYRSCEVYNNNGTWTFSRWIPGDKWTELPAGIMVGLPIDIVSANDANPAPRRLQEPAAIAISDPITAANLTAERRPSTNTTTGTSRAISIAGCDIADLPGNAAGTTVTMNNAVVFRSTGVLENNRSCNIELREAQFISDRTQPLQPMTSTSANEFYTICVRQNGKCVYYPELQTY